MWSADDWVGSNDFSSHTETATSWSFVNNWQEAAGGWSVISSWQEYHQWRSGLAAGLDGVHRGKVQQQAKHMFTFRQDLLQIDEIAVS